MSENVLHVILGKHGDICMALPALKRWADANGRPAALLTSAAYAPLLEGCSYVKVATAPSQFGDLQGILSYLKTDHPAVPVKCLQFYQSRADQVLPSFWHEQMYLAGLLGGGEDEPLVFDQRDEVRERILYEKTLIANFGQNPTGLQKPLILLGLTGKSSPFKDAASLDAVIRSQFGYDCNIVDLSTVKAERPYDLLGLYDHAAALISVDTLHLHLSKASNVPVFALACDYPTRWHGTPQLPRFTWYCRYSQVMERVDELVEALRNTLSGGQQKPKPAIIKWDRLHEIKAGGYNPSIVQMGVCRGFSYRYHPDRTWKTQLMLDGLPVRFPYPVSQCAHEDMRLFTFQGNLWASYVCSRLKDKNPRCITGYGELVRTPEFWAIKEHFQPNMSGNDWSGLEKNTVLFSHEDRLWMLWKNGITLRLMGEHAAGFDLLCESEPATWSYGEIRGGTSPLPFHGKWLRFFHSRIWDRENDKPWRYHMGALVMEPHPPFNVLHVSKTPILSGDESGDPMVWHYKHSVIFPLGAVEDDGGWLVSLGINDAHCAVLKLKESDLNL